MIESQNLNCLTIDDGVSVAPVFVAVIIVSAAMTSIVPVSVISVVATSRGFVLGLLSGGFLEIRID